jgi:hypothetical protein
LTGAVTVAVSADKISVEDRTVKKTADWITVHVITTGIAQVYGWGEDFVG